MNDDLYNKLLEYTALTHRLVTAATEEDYERINFFLLDRQKLIEEISQLIFTQEEFKTVVNDLKIIETQKKLDIVMEEKRNMLKTAVINSNVNRNANKNYNKHHYASISLINKQV
jgi:hypothetical protein